MQLTILSNMISRLMILSNMQVRRTGSFDFGIPVSGMTPLPLTFQLVR